MTIQKAQLGGGFVDAEDLKKHKVYEETSLLRA